MNRPRRLRSREVCLLHKHRSRRRVPRRKEVWRGRAHLPLPHRGAVSARHPSQPVRKVSNREGEELLEARAPGASQRPGGL